MTSRNLCICLMLALATLAVYSQAIHFDFVRFDDHRLVTQNRHVQQGLSWETAAWALRSGDFSNWFPLTRLSHMLDVELFGMNPGGHHASGVLLHLINTLLLFGVLMAMTREEWPSVLVAGLFALHPLHVESVAWVSERRDVLSAMFGLLSMAAYVSFAERGGALRYLSTALLLAMGLMAKPMLVTLPVVFLLLDYWPLQRVAFGAAAGAERRGLPGVASSPESRFPKRSVRKVVVEKIPLLLLSAASSVVTLAVQRAGGAMVAGAELPLLTGALPNAVVSYARYLGKTIWPRQLSVLYPHPGIPGTGVTPLEGWQIGASLALLVGISAAVIASRRRYALVGWLWYLGTLLPVIGLIQVGSQAMADRYTYLPLIGLFILVAWGAAELGRRLGARSSRLEPVLKALAVAVLIALLGASRVQAGYWRNSTALFTRAVEVEPRSPIAHNNLANALHARGRRAEAVAHYRVAVEVDPDYAVAHRNLANVLLEQNRLEEAIHHYRRAAELNPGDLRAQLQIARILCLRGEGAEAARHYRRSVEIAPESARLRVEFADLLASLGQLDEGIRHYRQALRIDPRDEAAQNGLERALKRRAGGREE